MSDWFRERLARRPTPVHALFGEPAGEESEDANDSDAAANGNENASGT